MEGGGDPTDPIEGGLDSTLAMFAMTGKPRQRALDSPCNLNLNIDENWTELGLRTETKNALRKFEKVVNTPPPAPRSRNTSPVPARRSVVKCEALDPPLSGISGRPEILPVINLTHACELGQLLGPVGNYPPEECYESEGIDTLLTSRRECIYPTVSRGLTHWGLHFDSNFECGNLASAYAVYREHGGILADQEEYDLYLSRDYTIDSGQSGHSLWYYFRVQNMKKNRKYRFNICNFSRRHSAYELGRAPLFHGLVALGITLIIRIL